MKSPIVRSLFATNYFDEDFVKKVHEKSGYSAEDQKELQKRISPLKDKYFKNTSFPEGISVLYLFMVL